MHLPLKIALSLPVAAAALIGLVIGLASPSMRGVHPVLKLPNFGFMAFFAAVAALIVVLPNLVAALAANRWGPNALVYCAVFIGTFMAAWLLQARALDTWLRVIGGFHIGDWRSWSLVAANVLLCLAAAAWYGRAGHA